MSERELTLKVLRKELSNVDDNVNRARLHFDGLTTDQMQEEHGFSHQTRQEILDGYESHSSEVHAAIAWVEAKP